MSDKTEIHGMEIAAHLDQIKTCLREVLYHHVAGTQRNQGSEAAPIDILTRSQCPEQAARMISERVNKLRTRLSDSKQSTLETIDIDAVHKLAQSIQAHIRDESAATEGDSTDQTDDKLNDHFDNFFDQCKVLVSKPAAAEQAVLAPQEATGSEATVLVWGDDILDIGILAESREQPTPARWIDLPHAELAIRRGGATFIESILRAILHDPLKVVRNERPVPHLTPSETDPHTFIIDETQMIGEWQRHGSSSPRTWKQSDGLGFSPHYDTEVDELLSRKPCQDLSAVKTLVINYEGSGLYRIAKPDWFDELNPDTIIFRYRPGGTPWPHWPLWLFYWLENRSDKVTMLVHADSLREDDLSVNSNRSWERTMEDIVSSRGYKDRHQFLRIAKHLIILFNHNGLLVRTRPEQLDSDSTIEHGKGKKTIKTLRKDLASFYTDRLEPLLSDPLEILTALEQSDDRKEIIGICNSMPPGQYSLLFNPRRSDRELDDGWPTTYGFLSQLGAYIAARSAEGSNLAKSHEHHVAMAYGFWFFLMQKKGDGDYGSDPNLGNPAAFQSKPDDSTWTSLAKELIDAWAGEGDDDHKIKQLWKIARRDEYLHHSRVSDPYWRWNSHDRQTDSTGIGQSVEKLFFGSLDASCLYNSRKEERNKATQDVNKIKTITKCLKTRRMSRESFYSNLLGQIRSWISASGARSLFKSLSRIETETVVFASNILAFHNRGELGWINDPKCKESARKVLSARRDICRSFEVTEPALSLFCAPGRLLEDMQLPILDPKRERTKSWSIFDYVVGINTLPTVERCIKLVRESEKRFSTFLCGLPHYERRPFSGKGQPVLSIRTSEIEALRSLEEAIKQYKLQHTSNRMAFSVSSPLSILVFGKPGSGKSTAAKALTSHVLAESAGRTLVCNLSQLQSRADLVAQLQVIRDETVAGKIPVIIFDEFDSALDGTSFGWLPFFLSPMEDGEFQSGQLSHRLGGAVFIFVGSAFESVEDFEEATLDEAHALSRTKGKDFLSRISGRFSVSGINRPEAVNDREPTRTGYIVERAILLRSLLDHYPALRLEGGGFNVSENLVRAFLSTREYKHNKRSVRKILELSSIGGRQNFDRSDLPSFAQLQSHVDALEFLDIVKRGEA